MPSIYPVIHSLSCRPATQKPKKMNMKRAKTIFLITILFNLFAMNAGSQNLIKNYEKDPIAIGWKTVEDFIKKNLPKSALTEVKKIYSLAKKEKQDAQVIKALVYMTSLQQENREDNSTT